MYGALSVQSILGLVSVCERLVFGLVSLANEINPAGLLSEYQKTVASNSHLGATEVIRVMLGQSYLSHTSR